MHSTGGQDFRGYESARVQYLQWNVNMASAMQNKKLNIVAILLSPLLLIFLHSAELLEFRLLPPPQRRFAACIVGILRD